MTRWIPTLLAAALLLGVTLDAPPAKALKAGDVLYASSNVWVYKGRATGINFQTGTRIMAGSQIEVLEVNRKAIRFLAKDVGISAEFVNHKRLPTDLIGSFRLYFDYKAPDHSKLSDLDKSAVLNGVLRIGMTRAGVLAAVGPPPAHRTASQTARIWTYWKNRWLSYEVTYANDGTVAAFTGYP